MKMSLDSGYESDFFSGKLKKIHEQDEKQD